MDGLVKALDIVKSGGIEALEKEIAIRHAVPLQLEISSSKIDATFQMVLQRQLNTFTVTMYKCVHDVFGAGEIRLKRLKEAFDKETAWLSRVDEFGYRYSTFMELAVMLNERYHMCFDLKRIEEVDRLNEASLDTRCSMQAIYDFLKLEGFNPAAERLREFFPEMFKTYRDMTVEGGTA